KNTVPPVTAAEATVWPQFRAAFPAFATVHPTRFSVLDTGLVGGLEPGSSIKSVASDKFKALPPSNRLVIGAFTVTVILPCNEAFPAVVLPTVGDTPPGKNPVQVITISPINSVNPSDRMTGAPPVPTAVEQLICALASPANTARIANARIHLRKS